MPQPTLKSVITIIILPSLTNEPHARLKGDRETHGSSGGRVTFSNQIKTQPDTPIQSGLSRVGSFTFNNESNCELDSHADTNMCIGETHAHIFMDHGKAVNNIWV